MRKTWMLSLGALLAVQCAPAPQAGADLDALAERLAGLEQQVAALGDVVHEQQQMAARLEEMESSLRRLEEAAAAGAEPTLSREALEELRAHLEELAAQREAAVSAEEFQVAVAQYVLDTAGFHDMDQALNETKEVNPAYLSAVRRAHKVLANAAWPHELAEPVEDFLHLLEQLQAALQADDGEESARLATLVHQAQHDLSHDIDGWLGEATHGHGD